MNPNFVQLTTTHGTPLYVRKEAILVVEGFTFAADHSTHPNHIGSRLTLQAGQWTEIVYCTEKSELVVDFLYL